MAISSMHYAELSEFAYNPPSKNENGDWNAEIGGIKYNVVEVVDNKSSGYQGVLFQSTKTGEFVVAHRGTEFKEEFIDDVLRADGGMVATRTNQQARDALALTERAMELARPKNAPVTVTGHSLGGCLAQIAAAKYGLHGETFNAYGAASLDQRIPEGGRDVVNHVMAADFVSSASHHYGEVKVYASRHDIATLSGAGYANNERAIDRGNLPVAIARGATSHSLHNFRDTDGVNPDLSVLRDPETSVNAHRFGSMIEKFRDDVWAMREGASLGGAILRGPMGIAEEIGRRLPEKPPESPFKDAHGALPAGEPRPFDPRHSDHPGHSMHGAVQAGVERVYAQQGRPFGEGGERTAAALFVDARLKGIDQVDHVVAGRSDGAGIDVFAVQGALADPAHKRAQVNSEAAERVPVEASFRQLAQAEQKAAALELPSQQQVHSQAARTA
ncbi:XVIPCD domain-containing protein [Lysobacter enzymogenes]|uniref:XVIPCD domain-containing protein n=1 Tax=Lysobacter enzymogenes TaxID=69 RepID=UPI00089A8B08|nr:XVIPCD domain-containing protein [Lysobacter enzymogenes]SDX76198.1 Lipase (class 3) [Lysobacter enzymogenes]